MASHKAGSRWIATETITQGSGSSEWAHWGASLGRKAGGRLTSEKLEYEHARAVRVTASLLGFRQ